MITSNVAQPATIAELNKIEIVKNKWLGNRWQGIQHGELVETIHGALDRNKIKVLSEGWFPSGPDLTELDGHMELEIPNHPVMNGTSYCLGVQHSNSGEHALKFAVGAKIFICSNGMVSGDYAIKRKHTIGVDVPELINLGIDTFLERVVEVPKTIESLQTMGLGVTEVNRALMTAGREGLMSWSRIGAVDAEYNKPTFADHAGDTGWCLYNAFTFVLQKMAPHYHIKGMNRFREIVLENVA